MCKSCETFQNNNESITVDLKMHEVYTLYLLARQAAIGDRNNLTMAENMNDAGVQSFSKEQLDYMRKLLKETSELAEKFDWILKSYSSDTKPVEVKNIPDFLPDNLMDC